MSCVTGRNKNRYAFGEKSGRKGKMDFSWSFQTTFDLMSKLDSKFEQVWF